jgi:hypothetical protein
MVAELGDRWTVLELLLLRDWWDSKLACRVFTGYVHRDEEGDYCAEAVGSRLLEIYDGKPHVWTEQADSTEDLWKVYVKEWRRSIHNPESLVFKNEDGGGDCWSVEYCVRWALRKKIYVPWLEWAIEKGYLPAEMSETATEKEALVEVEQTKESDATTPKFEHTPLTRKDGYFPALEKILKSACEAGEEIPTPLQVFGRLVQMEPLGLEFDKEKELIFYKNQDGEDAPPVTRKNLGNSIARRTKKL